MRESDISKPSEKLKQAIKRIPVLSVLSRFVYYRLFEPLRTFPGSDDYWKGRYATGGTSGDGSYDALAQFKADVLNALVAELQVMSTIEFGCGDGNQLRLSTYPRYLGVDISPEAIALCRQRFANDPGKRFITLDEYEGQQADMSLSLDVIYHLVEDEVFEQYMRRLFHAALHFTVIYSSNTDTQRAIQGKHIRHRKFTDWIDANLPEWELLRHVPNRYPYNAIDDSGSFADFHVYRRKTPAAGT